MFKVMANNCLVEKMKGNINNANLPKASDYENSIDLGLPSGLRWAKYNVDLTKADKFADSEYDYGSSYFSWGNTDGHNPVGTSFADITWNSTTYAQTAGASLNDNIPASQDAAKVNISSLWRTPTKEDFVELIENTVFVDANGDEISGGSVVITMNDVKGIRLKSTVNGNIIFFPCSGHGNEGLVSGLTSIGVYMTKSYYSADESFIFMPNDTTYAYATTYRYFGMTLRPVIHLDSI